MSALLVTGLVACTGVTRRTVTSQPATPSPAGAWYWAHRAVSPQGDLQLEEEQWQLLVSNRQHVTGHYDRSVTFISADGRPYRCNGEMSFTRRTRYDIKGHVAGAQVDLEETEYSVEPGPCESGVRLLDSYRGVVGQNRLVLAWQGGEQVLERRRRISKPASQEIAAAALNDIGGPWTWEQRTVDANGDRRVEAEEWTIERDGDRLEGHYQSVVTFTSGDSRPFACNGLTEYTTRAHFEFSGHVDGNKAELRETAYKTEPNPCDPGLRRLGSYAGVFDGQTLVLDWGQGRQALQRK